MAALTSFTGPRRRRRGPKTLLFLCTVIVPRRGNDRKSGQFALSSLLSLGNEGKGKGGGMQLRVKEKLGGGGADLAWIANNGTGGGGEGITVASYDKQEKSKTLFARLLWRQRPTEEEKHRRTQQAAAPPPPKKKEQGLLQATGWAWRSEWGH